MNNSYFYVLDMNNNYIRLDLMKLKLVRLFDFRVDSVNVFLSDRIIT